MAHPKRPRTQSQAFGQDRHTNNDDISLAYLAGENGNRVGNGVQKAIHDRTFRAIALLRGTKRKINKTIDGRKRSEIAIVRQSKVLYLKSSRFWGGSQVKIMKIPHFS
jgi:hypothetical protein